MSSLLANTYGKNRVRLVRVLRAPQNTELIEWTVNIRFEGEYGRSYTAGDNSAVLPTDTMKNSVYSLARRSQTSSPEEFAGELVEHFLRTNPENDRVTVEIAEKPWEHLVLDGSPHPDAFRQAGNELRIATVSGGRQHRSIRSGLSGLLIVKTAGSSFAGFKKDALTTLQETSDRLLGTNVSAEWGYADTLRSFGDRRRNVREALLAKFAGHESRSVQHTLFAMGEAVLSSVPEVTDIRLTMPNIHCLLVDLSRFGQDNPNEVFVPVDEPHGFIEAHIKRD